MGVNFSRSALTAFIAAKLGKYFYGGVWWIFLATYI